MIRLCHTADWELGPSGDRLDGETGLNSRMMDRARCAHFVIDDAVRRGARVVLHAGDVWRGAGESAYGCKPSPTQVWLAKWAFEPALTSGVPILILLGNHDMARSPAEKHALDLLRGIDGLTIVDRPLLLNAWMHGDCLGALMPYGELPDMADMGIGLQVACLPYPNKALLLRDEQNRELDPGSLNLVMRERVMDVLRGLAAQRIPGAPCILLAHCAIDVAEAGKQSSLAMLGGEWNLNLHELADLGFDLTLLGHYHRQQTLMKTPWIGYCGSPEAVTFAEEGEPKGYIDWQTNADPSTGWEGQFIETPFRRLITLEIGTSATGGCPDFESLLAWGDMPSDADISGAIVRLKLAEIARPLVPELRRHLDAAGAYEIRLEIERAAAVVRRETAVTEVSSLVESLDAWLEQKPELKPLRDDLQTTAMWVEQQKGDAL